MPTPIHAGRRSERGLAMATALFTLAALMVTLSAGMMVGGSGVRATRNYRGASQVHFVAESAILHALQVANAPGVVNVRNDVVTPWPTTMWGTSPRNFAPLAGYTYTVTATNPAGTNTADTGRLIATANGPEGMRNVVVANVRRSNIPSLAPGAIYLATDMASDATFEGTSFLVDGNDRKLNNTAGSGAPVPGIAARNDRNAQETRNSLSGSQNADVQGVGYLPGPPTVPSVAAVPTAPSVDAMNKFIDDLLSRPRPPDNNTISIAGNATYGTRTSPQITHFTGNGGLEIKGLGNVTGAGILIVEGNFTILGTFEFDGLVLVRGQVTIDQDPLLTTLSGNAKIYGSLWTENLKLKVGGHGQALYSTEALALANQVSGGAALPAPLVVVSLADCSELDSGLNGCP